MPVEVTDGIVGTHDHPYAVATYGRCAGSGKPSLTGPATPPAARGYELGKTYVDLGVLPSPLPKVHRDGQTVTISGVRFTHSTHCATCRTVVSVATEGGTIQLGFDRRGASFERERPGARPAYDGPCPNGCGHHVLIGGYRSDRTRATPVAEGRTVRWREWESLRRELGVWTVDMTRHELKRLNSA